MWKAWVGAVGRAARDLGPLVAVIAIFQLAVLREPFPELGATLLGLGAVLLGLTLFVEGLKMALFPIGEGLAFEFARRGSLPLLLAFAFALGFGTTIAEPALLAVADEAARVRAESRGIDVGAASDYALALRYTVAVAVGLSIMIGVVRIVRGWPIHHIIIGGYLIILALTPFAPEGIVGIAYDSGGVTTSTITVPLVTALGVGLSMSVKGRNPMVDGFGLIAFASLMPIMFVLVFGMIAG
jgi:Protein of unknown function (DUF1538)